MGVFGDYALKYLEQGYVVFPVIGKGGHGKTPYEWNKLTAKIVNDGKFNKGFLRSPQVTDAATNLIIEQSIQLNYDDCNIALLCGEVSGVIGFDIDTDDPQIVSLINQFIPQSRCVKRGSKGETRFFKYTKEFAQTERKGIYDLLSNGSYSVMPPSIHPETKEPYLELGESLYHVRPEDLPCIDANEYQKLKNIIDRMIEYKGEGRDNRLSRIGFAMACRGESLESITQELLKFDLTHHRSHTKGCFFQDTKKSKVRGKTPEQAATAFARRCIQDATKKGLVRNTKPDEQVFEYEIYEAEKIQELPLPPQWKIKTLIEEFARVNKREDNSYALPSAFILASAIIGPWWHMNGIYPNLDVIISGPSGGGKESGAVMIQDILRHYGFEKIIGPEVASDVAFVATLDDWEKRIRLDVIEECDIYLKEALLKKQGSYAKLGKYILQHSTWPGQHFNGSFALGSGVRGKCFSPYIVIYGSTTSADIAEVLKLNGFSSGFFSRFLWVFGKDLQPLEINKGGIDWDLLDYIIKPMIPFQSRLPYTKTSDFKSVQYSMDELIFYTKKSDKLAVNSRGERQNILVRQHILMSKIALIIACVENPQAPVVTSEMFEYAYKLAFTHTEILLEFHQRHCGNEADALLESIKRYPNGVTRREIYNSWRRRVSLKIFDELMSQLMKENLIVELQDDTSNKVKKRYFAVRHS